MHYRVLIRQTGPNGETNFPWIGLSRDPISTIIFQNLNCITVCVCFMIALAPDSQSSIRPLKIVWVIVACVCVGRKSSTCSIVNSPGKYRARLSAAESAESHSHDSAQSEVEKLTRNYFIQVDL